MERHCRNCVSYEYCKEDFYLNLENEKYDFDEMEEAWDCTEYIEQSKCAKCPHLEYCAEDHQIDLYMDGYFRHDMYECDVTLSDTYKTIPEFLATEAWKHCSKNKN